MLPQLGNCVPISTTKNKYFTFYPFKFLEYIDYQNLTWYQNRCIQNYVWAIADVSLLSLEGDIKVNKSFAFYQLNHLEYISYKNLKQSSKWGMSMAGPRVHFFFFFWNGN